MTKNEAMGIAMGIVKRWKMRECPIIMDGRLVVDYSFDDDWMYYTFEDGESSYVLLDYIRNSKNDKCLERLLRATHPDLFI